MDTLLYLHLSKLKGKQRLSKAVVTDSMLQRRDKEFEASCVVLFFILPLIIRTKMNNFSLKQDLNSTLQLWQYRANKRI